MKEKLFIFSALLIILSIGVTAYYVNPNEREFQNYNDYYQYTYGRFLSQSGMNYYPAPITQRVYYKIGEQQIDQYGGYYIAPQSVDDGYNSGYFKGYNDGTSFKKYGYEGYNDYVNYFKANTDPNAAKSGYYQMPEGKVKLTVYKVETDYDKGYNEGVVAGFHDGFYNIVYQGMNRDYYAYGEQYSGRFVPITTQTQPRYGKVYSTYPYFGRMNVGNVFYGFNY